MKNISLELKIPEGLLEDFSPVKIPLIYDRQLFISDLHLPYHSKESIVIALNYALERKANCIIIDGDLLDFYKASRFEQDPRARGLKFEIDLAREFLRQLRDLFPDAAIYFKEGNHDKRREHYLKLKAPELLDFEEFRLDVILKLRELKIEYVRDKRILQSGKLNIVHGHEFGKSFVAPVNPARGFYTKGKQNMVGGHHHQTSEHTEKDMNDNVVKVWSIGCLCDLHPKYLPINKWNHGFGYSEITDSDGSFYFKNLSIIKGEIR